jgi:predicted nucleic acid-binding protein
MHYAFIDTNIFIRVMSQGKPGCETDLFERLRVLATGAALTLVIPEVVRLELEGQMLSLSEDLKREFGELKKIINSTRVWSEIEDVKQLLLQQLDSLRDEKQERWHQIHKNIVQLFDSEKVSSIPFTAEIICAAKKRIIRGGMPNASSRVDQDAAIIESLVVYFSLIQDPQPVLFFCSENHSDFAIEVPKGKSRDRSFALHPVLSKDLPKTHFFTRLEELLQIDQGYESLPQPPNDEEIKEAMDRVDKLGSEYDFFDDDGADQYLQALADLDSILAKKYAAEIVPTLPAEFRRKREDMVKEIQNLLEQCRQCLSWDDRSEYKLSQWLEHVPEHMIPYTSLSNLMMIEANLHGYLSIHREMDNNVKG